MPPGPGFGSWVATRIVGRGHEPLVGMAQTEADRTRATRCRPCLAVCGVLIHTGRPGHRARTLMEPICTGSHLIVRAAHWRTRLGNQTGRVESSQLTWPSSFTGQDLGRGARVARAPDRRRLARLRPGLRVARGEPLLDLAVGEPGPGGPCETDDVMLWYSVGKPLTTVAVLQLWEQGRLGLDDLVAEYVAGLGCGQGAGDDPPRAHPHRRLPDVRRPTRTTATSRTPRRSPRSRRTRPSGSRAPRPAYHATSGWRVLGAIVEAVDGRRIDQYLVTRSLVAARPRRHVISAIPLDEQARAR